MSASGDMDRGHPLRRAMGEVAFLCAAHAAAWLDFEHGEGQDWRERAMSLARQLPVGAVQADPVCLRSVITRLRAFDEAVMALRRGADGEADWVAVVRRQGELRAAVVSALATLYHATLPVWERGEAPAWERFAAGPHEVAAEEGG